MPRPLNNTDTDLTADNLLRLPAEFGCPVWVYDAQIIRAQIAKLNQFDVVRFAQKACSNIHILRLMREQGVKVDSVSLGEIERALAAGYEPGEGRDDIVFTADMIDEATLARVRELHIPVNAGSVDMLEQLGSISPGIACGCALTQVWPRPQSENQHRRRKQQAWHLVQRSAGGADGDPALSAEAGGHSHAYRIRRRLWPSGAGVRRDGASGGGVWSGSGGDLRGGGLSIPYREGEEASNTDHYFGLWNAARQQIAQHLGHPVKLEIEPGRFLVAESGVLVAQVRSVKAMGSRHFVLIDAGFNDLMRPAMYGSYHHISALAATVVRWKTPRRLKPWWRVRCVNPAMSSPSRKGQSGNSPAACGGPGRLSGAARYRCLRCVDVVKLQQSTAAAGSAV